MEIFIFSYFVFLLMSLHKAIKFKSKWWFVIGLTPIINIICLFFHDVAFNSNWEE